MEQRLLSRFDRFLRARGYGTRSEALRDLVRDTLVQEEAASAGAAVFGAVTFVYDHHARQLDRKLTAVQHDHHEHIVATTHVHIDHDHCLEVVIVRGPAQTVRSIAEHLLSLKGVLHGKLTLTSPVS
jgi:CopG family nickel-responsive transcriptional regulator